MRVASIALCLLASALWTASVVAEEFAILGPRAVGMGGAGVAVTRGNMATYWNPAALVPPRGTRLDPFWDMSAHASISANATKQILSIIQELRDRLDGIDFDRLSEDLIRGRLDREQVDNLVQIVDAVPALAIPGTGIVGNLTPGLSFRVGRFGFSAMGLFNAGGFAVADFDRLSLGNNGLEVIFSGNRRPTSAAGMELARDLAQELQARGVGEPERIANEIAAASEEVGANPSDPRFRDLVVRVLDVTVGDRARPVDPDRLITNNQSGINLRGIILQEYAFGYSHPFFNVVSIGIAPKILYGTTKFRPFTLNQLGGFRDVLVEFFDGETRQGVDFTVDAGILAQPTPWLSLGFVGKYLTTPTFPFAGPGSYQIDPQFRAGFALGPFAGFTFAFDGDLVPNRSEALPDFRSQRIGGGLEYNLWDSVFLRTGFSNNIVENLEGVTIHAGVGARLGHFSLDLGAAISTRFEEINRNGDKIPERGDFSLAVSYALPLD